MDLSEISLSDFTRRLMRATALYAPELFKFSQTPGAGLMTIGRLGLFEETAFSRKVQFVSKLRSPNHYLIIFLKWGSWLFSLQTIHMPFHKREYHCNETLQVSKQTDDNINQK